MKLQLATLLLALISAEARGPRSNKAKKSILSKSRKLNDGDDAEEEEYAFLQNYKMKMVSCKAGEMVKNQENGEYEYNAIVYRMCPSSGDCDDDKETGCKEGYGDYVVGLNTFVQAYMEEQAENMGDDDNFRLDEYAECREYENDNDDGNGYAYYIGPACTEDGTDVKLELYYDEACTQVPEDVTFEDISNGWTMPYSDGGVVSTSCGSCMDVNDDGEYELREMCERLYEESAKCETEMEYYGYYGKQEGACEYIETLLPSKSGSGSLGFLAFIVIIAAFGGYAFWWKKKKAANSAAASGLMS